MNNIFDWLLKLKFFYILLNKEKWFVASLTVFLILALAGIKYTYSYFLNKLPVQEEIILPSFPPPALIADLKNRLSFLTSHVNGVRFTIYKIKMRDNLWKIAKRNGYSVHTIIGCNPQLETYNVQYNEKIVLPSKPGTLHIIQADDTFDKISKRYDTSIYVIKKLNPYMKDLVSGGMLFIPDRRPSIALMNEPMRKKYELRSLFTSPLGGRLSSVFGMRKHPVTRIRSLHGGIDIAVKSGTWVGAAASGVVVLASHDIGHYGTAIFIDHGNGYVTHYGHLSKIYVRVGQKVKARQLIAKSGSTGRSTGPHLHFTIKKNDASLDPLKFIW
ncbi:MAG: M23 family metallopeptidase [Elusimicrobia bacterium]|nr:M23 family metallopeptidase [Candidatus Liberimonas magnetica]